jgi:hypothetical protein
VRVLPSPNGSGCIATLWMACTHLLEGAAALVPDPSRSRGSFQPRGSVTYNDYRRRCQLDSDAVVVRGFWRRDQQRDDVVWMRGRGRGEVRCRVSVRPDVACVSRSLLQGCLATRHTHDRKLSPKTTLTNQHPPIYPASVHNTRGKVNDGGE